MFDPRLALYVLHALALVVWAYTPAVRMLSLKVTHLTMSMALLLLI